MTSQKCAIIVLHPAAKDQRQKDINYQYTANCIQSLCQFEPEVPVLIVDNGSHDLRLENICHQVGGAVVSLEVPLSFAGANNFGFSQLKDAQAVLFLNNDVLLVEALVAKMLVVLTNPTVGIVGPLTKNRLGQINYAGGSFKRVVARPKELSQPVLSVPYAVDYVSGCALMIRASLFSCLAGFDPYYSFGMEDVDLCRRAAALNYASIIAPTISVIHLGGGASGGSTTPLVIGQMLSGNLYLIKKHYSRLNRIIPYLYLVFLTIKIGLKSVQEKRLRTILPVLREAWQDR